MPQLICPWATGTRLQPFMGPLGQEVERGEEDRQAVRGAEQVTPMSEQQVLRTWLLP